MSSKIPRLVLLLPLLIFLPSCNEESDQESVTIYTSLDRPHSEPILKRFQEKTGIKVNAIYDTEASKTVGLVNRLIAEKSNPKADVFWNSEVLRTLMLKEKGLLTPYHSTSSEAIPQTFKDVDGFWTGFGARARVILYNTNHISAPPTSLAELTQAKWKDQVAIANPLFGTTNTQLASQWAMVGEAPTQAYFQALKANGAKIVSGNGPARDLVSSGEIPLCLTDTDDAWGAISKGRPVKMIYPDQDGTGTLLIPNTVCLINNCPHPETGKQLIDFLLSEEVESILAHSESAQIPVRSTVSKPDHVKSLGEIKAWEVDFGKARLFVEEASQWALDHFID